MLLAIDPGPKLSAWVLYNGDLFNHGRTENLKLLERILWNHDHEYSQAEYMVIEEIRSYGRPVGQTTFDTVEWIGIFRQAFGLSRAFKLPRLAVKKHISPTIAGDPHGGIGRVSDAVIRQALKDRWRERTGLEKPWLKGGPLYGVVKDVWQALALAVTWWETQKNWSDG